jgi:transcriptional antiterminator RfaH
MSYWAVVRTKPSSERLAVENVTLRGFEVFVPRIRTRVGSRWLTTPLFGCYFFVRVVDRWRAIERSPGVISLVKFGETPARCPDEDVGRLLERSDRDGIIRLPPRPSSPGVGRIFEKGAAVAISDGPLRGFDGIYAGMSGQDREIVLLTILGTRRPVEISAGLLAPH